MAPKIQFNDTEKKLLIQSFDEVSSKEHSVLTVDVPALFFEKTNKNVSYRVLKKIYDEIKRGENPSEIQKDSKSTL